MQDANPVATPMDPTVKLRKKMGSTCEEKKAMDQVPYRQAIGALMYIARATRYDIAHTVNVLAQYGADPEPAHWVAVKRVFRYLKGTSNQTLTYRRSDGRMHIYSDASLATDPDDRRSYTGIATFLGTNLVDWIATKQKCVSVSTMEAEYRALGQATKEALWIRSLLREIGHHGLQEEPTTIYTDSLSALAHATSRIENSRSKYIDITCHFVREHVDNGDVKMQYVVTKYNLADIFTKPQPGPRHRLLMRKICLSATPDVFMSGEAITDPDEDN